MAAPTTERNVCNICMNEIHDELYPLCESENCGADCKSCVPCLRELVENTWRSGLAFVPSFCTEDTIPISTFEAVILGDAELTEKAPARHDELATAPGRRVYCAYGRCSNFLGASTESDSAAPASCYNCSTQTCLTCRVGIGSQGAAENVCGPTDTELAIAAQCAAEEPDEAWKTRKCPGCNAFVHKSEACNHMTCVVCHFNFCIYCGCEFLDLHGCPQSDKPVYDEDGYNQLGFNITDLRNRLGETWEEEQERRRRDALRLLEHGYVELGGEEDDDLDVQSVIRVEEGRMVFFW